MIIINSLKKLGLFSFFLILIASCKKPEETLGESIQPGEDIISAFQTDTTAVYASTLKIDSLRSDVFANISAGNYFDEYFGTVRCKAVFQLAPTSLDSIPATRFTVDSVVLLMAYQPEAYGNNIPMYFEVNELDETIYLDSSYYTNHHVEKKNLNLVEPGHETVQTLSEEAAFLSTDEKAYLRLKLRNSLGEKLMKKGTSYTDFTAFRSYFKGLVVSSQTIDGRVVNFATPDSKVSVYYHKNNDPQVHDDAALVNDFVFTSACEAFTTVDHQYFGTSISPLSSGMDVDGDYLCYAQSAGGTRLKIDLRNALGFRQLDKVSISKAELVIPYDISSKFAPIDTLTAVFQKTDGLFYLTEDFRYSPGAVYSSVGVYRQNITRHLQGILNGTIESTELYLVANPKIAGFYNSMGVRRSLIHGPGFSATDPTQNMRLIVTYNY